jgi:hypothetical protein
VKIELAALISLTLGCGGVSTVDQYAATLPKERLADFREFANNCSKCHGLERALNAHVTSTKHWDLYVARMMRTPGSGISPREAPGILSFLHYHTERRNHETGDEKP